MRFCNSVTEDPFGLRYDNANKSNQATKSGGITMKAVIDKKLRDYMENKKLKNIVLFKETCNTWGGSYEDIAARFADEEEKEELKASGFKSIPTETGELFVPERGISVSENIKLGLVKFLWGTRITIKGVAVQ